MSMNADIMERLAGVVQEYVDDDVDWKKAEATTTIESFGFDSLSLLDLIFDIEQEFGVKIQAQEMAKVRTVGDLVTLIESRTA